MPVVPRKSRQVLLYGTLGPVSSPTPAAPRRVTVLSGGYGGARFVQGLLHALASLDDAASERAGDAAGAWIGAEVTVVANTADDLWLHGLKICPDLDTVMYTLGDGIDPDRGWGRRAETWSLKEELAAYGAEAPWFGLGDRDLATHLMRTRMLESGYPLSAVTEALCRRWQPGVRLLPMSDDRVETHIVVADPDAASGRAVMHFQEWWIRYQAQLPAQAVLCVGQEDATAGPGVLAAIAEADVVIVPPSNPVVSVGTILGVPGVREAVRTTSAPVVGVSPIVGGTHVRGMANQLLATVGVDVSAAGVARHYGSRSGISGGLLDGWLVDTVDAEQVASVRELGPDMACEAVPLMMTDVEATAAMARAVLTLAPTLALGS